MLLDEITERIVRSCQGGKAKDETEIDFAYIESKVPKWRQAAMSILYNGSREQAANSYISPDWYQTITIEVPSGQSNNNKSYITATVPSVIRINSNTDGFVFVGDDDDSVNFIRISSPSYASDLMSRGDLTEEVIGFIVLGSDIRFYGNKQLETFTIQAILSNPLDDPNFDIDNDPYPVSEDVISVMERIAMGELLQEQNTPEDLTNDGVDTKDRRVNKANIV
jgi:hypothetical protein